MIGEVLEVLIFCAFPGFCGVEVGRANVLRAGRLLSDEDSDASVLRGLTRSPTTITWRPALMRLRTRRSTMALKWFLKTRRSELVSFGQYLPRAWEPSAPGRQVAQSADCLTD